MLVIIMLCISCCSCCKLTKTKINSRHLKKLFALQLVDSFLYIVLMVLD